MNQKVKTVKLIFHFWVLFPLVKLMQLYFTLRGLFPKKRQRTILYLESLPIENAGYQYRSYKWKQELEKLGWNVTVKTIIADKKKYDQQRFESDLIDYIILAMWKRFGQVLCAGSYHAVVVRRELLQYNDYGHLFMERLLKAVNPNLILDFDDNIAAAKGEPRTIKNAVARLLLEDGDKFLQTLKFYKKFIVGNKELERLVVDQAPQTKPGQILFIPTCVDYNQYPVKHYLPSAELKIGWIGGVGNLPYLDLLLPALVKIHPETPIRLVVISGKDYIPKLEVPFVIENLQWSLETEVNQLLGIDIGVMPLPANEMTSGKSGFKLLQYMGLGLVAIADGVGINAAIVNNGVNGFLVGQAHDWYSAFKQCIAQKDNWQAIGAAARKTVDQTYTFEANRIKYSQFLENIIE